LLWLGCAIVALVELGVGGLVLMPRVSDAYRAYYIERSSDCWPHETPATYSLGSTLSFIYGHRPPFDPNKICGWFYPNEHGTWSYGRYSVLRFNFAPAAAPLTLTITAGALVSQAHPIQHVLVSANGTPVTTLAFDSAADTVKTLTLPADIASGGHLELRFDYPDARPGTELGPNEDQHLRAVRMVALTLAAAG
jgi:hypothetical protein